MKKMIISFLLVLVLVSSNAFTDERMVLPSMLPEKATAFLKEYFKDIAITTVEQDTNDFEVTLKNGTEITFLTSGEWQEVDGKHQPIPTTFIPQPVLNALIFMYPSANIICIETDWVGFEVELSNNVDLKIDAEGKVHPTDTTSTAIPVTVSSLII